MSEGEEEGDAAAEEAAAKESEALVRAAHQTTESLDAAAMAELFSPTKRASLSGPAGFGSANGSPKCGRRIRRRSTAVSMIGQSEVEKALDVRDHRCCFCEILRVDVSSSDRACVH